MLRTRHLWIILILNCCCALGERLCGSLESSIKCFPNDHSFVGKINYMQKKSTFVQCILGVAHIRQCPGNLLFNERLKICDWPENACCSVAVTEKVPTFSNGITNDVTVTAPPPLGPCTMTSCRPPNCTCASQEPPEGLNPKDVPQMITISFDDGLLQQQLPYFKKLLQDKYNPNGCPIAFTHMVSGDNTQYSAMWEMATEGAEIGSHSASHADLGQGSYDTWVTEIEDWRIRMANNVLLEKASISGMRAPYLSLGSNTQFQMLLDKSFLYDSSFSSGPLHQESDQFPYYPFTLDHPLSSYSHQYLCNFANCPTGSFPGVWEVPLNRVYTTTGQADAMFDGENASAMDTKEEVLEHLRLNFRRHYDNNRAPFGVHLHGRWLQETFRLEAMDHFLKEVTESNDVWVLQMHKVILWMQHPVPINQTLEFKEWKC